MAARCSQYLALLVSLPLFHSLQQCQNIRCTQVPDLCFACDGEIVVLEVSRVAVSERCVAGSPMARECTCVPPEMSGVNSPLRAQKKPINVEFIGFSAVFKSKFGVPYGNRTRVTGVKGRCPRPLDEQDVPGTKFYGRCR